MKKTKKNENNNSKKTTKDERTVTLPRVTSPSEFASINEFKPLSDKEVKRGKYKVKIAGTKEPIPWDVVYSQIRSGYPYEDIQHEFGEIRKIIMFAIEDSIEYLPLAGELLDEEVGIAEKKTALAAVDLTLVKTIEEGVSRYAPDLIKNVSIFGAQLVQRATHMINTDYATTSDLLNASKAVQTVTDTLEVTQRHSAGVQIGNAQVAVQGFEFVLDSPPEDNEVIEVETDG